MDSTLSFRERNVCCINCIASDRGSLVFGSSHAESMARVLTFVFDCLINSYVVLSLFANQNNQKQALNFIETTAIPTRCTILLYVAAGKKSGFPINLLRNLAIFNIQTTHFMMLDIDLSIPCIHFHVSTSFQTISTVKYRKFPNRSLPIATLPSFCPSFSTVAIGCFNSAPQ